MARSSGGAAGLVLFTLATAQFLMTLDSSVTNVSIAQVAADVGTTVTGIQTAITLCTLVMASLMITGGKVGGLIGRRRAFAAGCVVYACGSFVTAIAPNLDPPPDDSDRHQPARAGQARRHRAAGLPG